MTNPQPNDSEAIAAFLACSEGDLCERTRLWLKHLKEVEKQMQEKGYPVINERNTKD